MSCLNPNCKVCSEGLWTWAWKDFVEVIKSAKWDELKFIFGAMVLGYILLGWFGVILFFFLCKMVANTEGGSQFYTAGTPKIKHKKCSLGHEKCRFTARKVW